MENIRPREIDIERTLTPEMERQIMEMQERVDQKLRQLEAQAAIDKKEYEALFGDEQTKNMTPIEWAIQKYFEGCGLQH